MNDVNRAIDSIWSALVATSPAEALSVVLGLAYAVLAIRKSRWCWVAGGTGSAIAKGGMLTKVLAAKRAARSGAQTVIASGHEPDVLVRIAAGEAVGTLLTAQTTPLAARKQWLADHVQVGGRLSIDAGAAKALRSGGKSLLPIGVKGVEGEFERGAVVACFSPEGTEIARGLVNYNAQESRRIAGRASGEIEAILGYIDGPELIHRDNLVLL